MSVVLQASPTFRLQSQFSKIEEGWVMKQGHVRKNWNKRYLSMDMERHLLSYYADETKKAFKSQYHIFANSVVKLMKESTSLPSVLSLQAMCEGTEKTLNMTFETQTEQERWHEILMEAIAGVKVKQPKLCEPFHNSIPLKVVYDFNGVPIEANDGCTLTPKHTKHIPKVEFKGSTRSSYTLIMVNPDGPAVKVKDGGMNGTSPGKKSRMSVFSSPNRHFAHWVVVNIPENDISAGHNLLPYIPACPLSKVGPQRYFFLLFKQDSILSQKKLEEAELVFEKRGGLQVCTWAAQQAMGLPVGVNGFTCGWESFCDTVHMEIGLLPPVEYRSPSQLSQYGHAYPVNDARYNEMQYDEDDGCCACVQCGDMKCFNPLDICTSCNCCNNDDASSMNQSFVQDWKAMEEENSSCCSFLGFGGSSDEYSSW